MVGTVSITLAPITTIIFCCKGVARFMARRCKDHQRAVKASRVPVMS
jgi:hypothetical protein